MNINPNHFSQAELVKTKNELQSQIDWHMAHKSFVHVYALQNALDSINKLIN